MVKYFDKTVLNSDDKKLVLNIINMLDEYDNEDWINVINMLFGLFDGYWYVELEDVLDKIDEVDTHALSLLTGLLDKVEKTLQ
jgi:hypothetical protein